jgi:hypothetical protein
LSRIEVAVFVAHGFAPYKDYTNARGSTIPVFFHLNGQPISYRTEHSGDSDWVWVKTQKGNEEKIAVDLK